MQIRLDTISVVLFIACQVPISISPLRSFADHLSSDDWKLVQALEKQRINAIDSVVGSVIAIYDEDRQGGGSGVVIDPSGIALTNHHVIMGAGISGWGGLADGQLYHWKLIGTDPGGDVSIIQLDGRNDFPFTPLGDSDSVRVGDWALAMGNPFILTEDQSPTVTMGIVSGIKRYQPGAGANQLVYGNCIQVDSSINPGNSGGPLFNFHSRVIGINGRGSFQDRGRVNVGLGYAISANQIKNFIPDLLATKLVEHGTLDASFSNRGGKVVCSTINRDAPVAKMGLDLGDELLKFEGQPIVDANQFTNLICTLPADWPAVLKIRKPSGDQQTMHVRLLGLPYPVPQQTRPKKGDKKPTPEEKDQIKRQQQMVELLAAPPGKIRQKSVNRRYAKQIIAQWQNRDVGKYGKDFAVLHLVDDIQENGRSIGQQELHLATDGKFRILWDTTVDPQMFLFDGEQFLAGPSDENLKPLARSEARRKLPIAQALSLSAAWLETPFQTLGTPLIDGSDKALQENAYRMSWSQGQQDDFFVWLRMYDDAGLPSPRLQKVSANKDCEEEGGVIFSRWERVGNTLLPLKREFVRGLAETPFLNLVNQKHQWLDNPDPLLFKQNQN